MNDVENVSRDDATSTPPALWSRADFPALATTLWILVCYFVHRENKP